GVLDFLMSTGADEKFFSLCVFTGWRKGACSGANWVLLSGSLHLLAGSASRPRFSCTFGAGSLTNKGLSAVAHAWRGAPPRHRRHVHLLRPLNPPPHPRPP